MGKVGSSTVYELIKDNSSHTVIHLHKMGWNNLERSLDIYEILHRIKYIFKVFLRKFSRTTIEIYVGYRSPVDRIISAYFQNLDESSLSTVSPNRRLDYLKKDFSSKKSIYIKNTVEWFDKELYHYFGISIEDFNQASNHNYFFAKKKNVSAYLYSMYHVEDLMRNQGYLGEFERYEANTAELKWYSEYKKSIQVESDGLFSLEEKEILNKTDVHELFEKHNVRV